MEAQKGHCSRAEMLVGNPGCVHCNLLLLWVCNGEIAGCYKGYTHCVRMYHIGKDVRIELQRLSAGPKCRQYRRPFITTYKSLSDIFVSRLIYTFIYLRWRLIDGHTDLSIRINDIICFRNYCMRNYTSLFNVWYMYVMYYRAGHNSLKTSVDWTEFAQSVRNEDIN